MESGMFSNPANSIAENRCSDKNKIPTIQSLKLKLKNTS